MTGPDRSVYPDCAVRTGLDGAGQTEGRGAGRPELSYPI